MLLRIVLQERSVESVQMLMRIVRVFLLSFNFDLSYGVTQPCWFSRMACENLHLSQGALLTLNYYTLQTFDQSLKKFIKNE